MTQKEAAKARKRIGKWWYKRWRIGRLRKESRIWDKMLICVTDPLIEKYCLEHIIRLTKKKDWYYYKMQYGQGDKE